MKARLRSFVTLLALLAWPYLAGCTTNPATGEQSFTGLMSESDEARIGREENPKILAEFGGAYDDPELARYVSSVGDLLASTSERSNVRFTFTIINSPIVNAFALPGGYVYVTRGLLALASTEAEAAGVIAHEIGHVAARHSAQRYSTAVAANIGAVLLGVLTGSGEVANAAGTGAAAFLQSYSRDQEFEADTLGVRYLSRATYDPQAMASFLEKLQASSQLQAQLAGRDGADDTNIMSTHPRTADRVDRAIRTAGGTQVANPIVARDIYFDKIDGMLYGDDPQQGFIRGRRFAHPVLRFAFEAPPGFRLYNSQTRVTARGPDGAAILFDRARQGDGGRMTDYLANEWGDNLDLQDVERIDVNGMEGATGHDRVQTNSGTVDLRLVAIRYDSGTIYRFVFISPPSVTNRLSEDFRRTTYSFRKLSAGEAAALKPLRLRVVTVRPGDTVASLAGRMAYDDYREERFRVLNGLFGGAQVRSGDRVKIVTE